MKATVTFHTCPTCGAVEGEVCRTPAGHKKTSVHDNRPFSLGTKRRIEGVLYVTPGERLMHSTDDEWARTLFEVEQWLNGKITDMAWQKFQVGLRVHLSTAEERYKYSQTKPKRRIRA